MMTKPFCVIILMSDFVQPKPCLCQYFHTQSLCVVLGGVYLNTIIVRIP